MLKQDVQNTQGTHNMVHSFMKIKGHTTFIFIFKNMFSAAPVLYKTFFSNDLVQD